MPEHAALAVCGGRFDGGGGGFPHGEILVVRADDFCVAGKANKVFDDVEQPRLVEDALNKGVKLGVLRILITAVLSLAPVSSRKGDFNSNTTTGSPLTNTRTSGRLSLFSIIVHWLAAVKLFLATFS
jgi:hypothetical protein